MFLHAQDTVNLKIKSETMHPFTNKLLNASFENIDQAKKEVGAYINELQKQGYLGASIDSFAKTKDTLFAFLHLGNQFTNLHLNMESVDPLIKKTIKLPLQDVIQLKWSDWDTLTEQLLLYGENNGFPFSKVQLQNIQLLDTVLKANILYTLGKQYNIDSIEIRGNAKINQNYIEEYLDLKKGDIYNEYKIGLANQKLTALPFLKNYRVPAVEFFDNKARLFLFLNEEKVNRFDFLLGILPNSTNDRNFQITGEGLLTLINILGYGEKFHLEYKNLPNSAKTLFAQIESTYLPMVPLGTNIQFNLHIKDTTYINRNLELGLLYSLKNNNFIKLFYEIEQSNLLEINEQQVIDELALPDNIDWRRKSYGVALHYEQLDYRFNPTKGIRLDFSGSLGSKTILENIRILELEDPMNPNFNFKYLYDNIDRNIFKFEMSLGIEKYWKINSTSVVKTSINSSYIYASENEKSISESELYRIGGLGKNSYFSIFSDISYIKNSSIKLNNTDYYDIPISFGAGINFETSAGIFSLNYALGKRMNTSISFKSAKIHFGYLNYF